MLNKRLITFAHLSIRSVPQWMRFVVFNVSLILLLN